MSGRPTDQTAAAIAQALMLVRSGQWAAAESALDRVLSANPREPEALQLLGLVREKQGRPQEAQALLNRSLALRPRQPRVQAHLGRILAAGGKYHEAIALLRTAIRAQPRMPDALVELALAQMAVGDGANAEKNYRSALQLEPGSVAALHGLGTLLTRDNRAAEGEAFLRIAAAQPSLPPGPAAQIAHALGIALDMQGRHEDAIAAFRRAIALDPLHAPAHQELNALLYRLGRDGEFLSSYDMAVSRAPVSGALLLQKGGFLLRTERFEEARDCFARVAAMAPNSAGPQNGMALAFAGLGQLDASIAAQEKSLDLQPGEPRTMLNLACTLLEAGDARRALDLTDAVLPQMPFDQSALAVRELALRANDDPRALEIADYDRHVQIFDLEPPPGFSSMLEFNAALNAHLDSLHTDLREHVDQTLRHGTQTAASLLGGDNALVQALRLRIEDAVAVYISRMADADKALAGRRRSGFSFVGSWSSRLRDCGFQLQCRAASA